MGVFLYSNQKIDQEKVKYIFKTRGHKKIQSHSNDKYNLLTAPKTLVANENYIGENELGKGNYAVGIGTYFYKDSYGKEALREVFNDIETVISDNPVYGHWAFCIRKNGETYIINDMSGFMRLFITQEGNNIIVSSSMLAVVSAMNQPKFDKPKLSGFLAGRYGAEATFIQNINTLDPHKYIVISEDGTVNWNDKAIPEVPRIQTLEEAVIYVKTLLNKQMSVIKGALRDEKVYTDATGGLDSRLMASNLHSTGINFDFMNYPIFGPDAEIAEILSKGINKKLHVQTDDRVEKDNIKEHLGEFDYGNNFFRQYANPRWNIENKFEFSGARGECIDLPDIYSDEDLSFMKDTRPEVLLKNLTVGPMMTELQKDLYLGYLMNLLSEREGFKKGIKLSEKQQVKFTQFFAGQFGDAMYNSGAQANLYFYSLYNEWHFNHFISDIAFDAKKCRKLTLALISSIDPELGSFPFVSRMNTARRSVNEVHELPMKYSVYPSWLKNLMPLWLKNFLYNKVGLRKNNIDKSLLKGINWDLYKDVVRVNQLKKYPIYFHTIIKRIYSLEQVRTYLKIEF